MLLKHQVKTLLAGIYVQI